MFIQALSAGSLKDKELHEKNVRKEYFYKDGIKEKKRFILLFNKDKGIHLHQNLFF